MPVNEKLLRGPDLAREGHDSHQYSYTRKKRRDSNRPHPRDTIAWRWNGSAEPVQVFRSPSSIAGQEWLTREEREALICSLLMEGCAFTSRRGFTPIFDPVRGQEGWLKIHSSHMRRKHCFIDGAWIPCKRWSD